MPRKPNTVGFKQLRRHAQHPTRVASGNNAIVTRQFRYTTQIEMNTENTAQGGVVDFFTFNNSINDYIGSEYISVNHEQFRVKRIKLMARPSTGLYPPPAADASVATVIDTLQLQVSQYNLANYTEVQSFIDYDSATVPSSYNELLSRPNLKIQCLKPTDWTMIANFTPKIQVVVPDTSSPSIVFPQTQWQSSIYLGASLYGVRGRFSNRYNGPNISLPLPQSIDIFAIATVEMRGVRNNFDTTNLSIPRGLGGRVAPTPQLRENDISDEDSDADDSVPSPNEL